MRKSAQIHHVFVEQIPRELQEGVLYISIPFATAVHLCFCGCHNEVVTPLTPTDWSLSYDGDTVSLNPSVGSWNLPCQSHYWIHRSRVISAPRWSRRQIRLADLHDQHAKEQHFATKASGRPPASTSSGDDAISNSFWRRFLRWFS